MLPCWPRTPLFILSALSCLSFFPYPAQILFLITSTSFLPIPLPQCSPNSTAGKTPNSDESNYHSSSLVAKHCWKSTQIGVTINHWCHSKFTVSDIKWTLSAAWQSFSISLGQLSLILHSGYCRLNPFLIPTSLSLRADEFIPASQRTQMLSERRTTSIFSINLYPYSRSKTIVSYLSLVTCLFCLKVILEVGSHFLPPPRNLLYVSPLPCMV